MGECLPTTPAAGLPTAAGDGFMAIREICAEDGKEFVTSIPAAAGEDGDERRVS